MAAGDQWNADHYGTQQHIPLAEIDLPDDLVSALRSSGGR
jgi:hypothetical protein